MKHLKTKLMASVAMLMVATVMISSASFAWFTLSTQPEVSGVSTGLATNQALEIALVSSSGFTATPSVSGQDDTGKNVTWGNLVDVSTYFNNSENNATLRPAIVAAEASGSDYSKGDLLAPKFGADGRTNGASKLSDSYKAVGDGTSSYQDGVIKVYADAAGTPYAYQIDYFMRTNVAGNAIKLLAPDATSKDRGSGQDGAGTTITENTPCTVKFKVDDGDWVTYYSPATGSFDFTTPLVSSAVKDQIYKVSMLVYWDGSDATNANLAVSGQTCAVNAQFTTSSPLTGIGTTGDAAVNPKP